jgi:hypothetical protein
MQGTLRFFAWSVVLSLVLWKLGPVAGFDVSRFPGTFTFQSGTYGIQVPLLFCLIVSAVLTLLLTLARRLRR